MKTMIKWMMMVAALLMMVGPAQAQSNYNERYGEIRFNKLPGRALVSKIPWVGSWWAYSKSGIAHRWNKADIPTDSGPTYGAEKWNNTLTYPKENLSPAEKVDHYVGRADKIQTEVMSSYLKKVIELGSTVSAMMKEKQDLVRVLNNLIEENSSDPTFNWKDSDDGKKYLELGESIKTSTEPLDELKAAWKLDTALEYEVMHHGEAQFNIGGWWGHCNAWAAAAIMEEEPRFDAIVKGIPFAPGDVKALITEAWMECNSSFYGSRNDYHADEASRAKVDYADVTPAAFHIFFADQLGNKDKSFVIDRYTGDQVWNQPVAAFRSWMEPMYVNNEAGAPVAFPTEVRLTKYNHKNIGKVQELGTKDVYPVKVKTTMWWITDGVPHNELTVTNIDDTLSDEDFSSASTVKQRYDDQVHIRTLNYVLWLDKPMTDENARIVGDGAWEHGSSVNYAHNHPDFLWQPLANTNDPYRDYENEFVPYSLVINEILPKTLVDGNNVAAPEVPNPPAQPEDTAIVYSAVNLPAAIADNAPNNPTISAIPVDSDFAVKNMVVRVEITHSYIGDLQISLEGPGGAATAAAATDLGCTERTTPGCDGCACETCVCNADDYCCSTAWDNLCVTACQNDCGGCAGGGAGGATAKSIVLKKKNDGGNTQDIAKSFDVKAFDGMSAKGNWTLRVTDNANEDTGSLTKFSVKFE
jgi:subtilisin-like proprotein convertase family protein